MIRRAAAVFALFGALAAMYTWPVAGRFGTSMPGDPWEPCEMALRLSHGSRALFFAPADYFDAPVFFPHRGTGAYSEPLVALSALTAPLLLFTTDPAPLYDFAFLLTFALAGTGACFLGRAVTGSWAAGIAAGLVYAFNPWRMNQVTHLPLLASCFLPFVFLALRAFLRKPGPKSAAVLTFAALAQASASWYFAIYLAVLLPIAAAASLVRTDRTNLPRFRRTLAWLWGSCVAVGIPLCALALPYLAHQAHFSDFKRGIEEAAFYSGDPRDLFVAPEACAVLGPLTADLRAAGAGEKACPGLAVPLLAFLALFMALRKRSRVDPSARFDTRLHALLAATAFVLSLGPYLRFFGHPVALWIGDARHEIPLPYLLLHKIVPGFSALRGPTRVDAFLFLSLSVLAAQGVALLARNGHLPRAALAIAAIGAEYWTVPVPTFDVPGSSNLPACYAFLRASPESPKGAVLELTPHFRGPATFDGWYPETSAMYFAALHGHPIGNGYAGYIPPATHELKQKMPAFPTDDTVSLLADAGFRFVLAQRRHFPSGDYDRLLLSVVRTPQIRAAYSDSDAIVWELPPSTATSDLSALRATLALAPAEPVDGLLEASVNLSSALPVRMPVDAALTLRFSNPAAEIRLPVPVRTGPAPFRLPIRIPVPKGTRHFEGTIDLERISLPFLTRDRLWSQPLHGP